MYSWVSRRLGRTYERLLHSMPESAALYDEQDRFLFVNENLAEWYGRPRELRRLVGRLWGEAYTAGDGVFVTTTKTTEKGGRPGTAYYLGEKAALKVVTKSETAQADAITDSVIEVFIQARMG